MSGWQKSVTLAASLAIGNGLYQIVSGGMDWGVAMERSFFCAVGVVMTAWVLLGARQQIGQ